MCWCAVKKLLTHSLTSTLYMLLCQQTHEAHSNYLLVAVESPFIPKVIDCKHQTIKTYVEREHSILLSTTHTLYVYQVCHSVGRYVKDGSCSSWSLEWKSIAVLMGYLTISTNVRHYQTQTDGAKNRTFRSSHQEDSALVHMHCVCNTVQLMRRSRLPFSSGLASFRQHRFKPRFKPV